jgi:MFS family permease
MPESSFSTSRLSILSHLLRVRAALFPEQDQLPTPIWVIFSVQVVNRMGDFVAPFITLLFTRKIGLPESAVGALVTATALTGMVGNLAAGKLCDHFGRKRILGTALFFVGILNGACGFLEPGLPTAFILVFAGFFQGAVRPTVAAMLADLAPAEKRRQAWSLNYLGINIGAAVGPMMAGLLFERNLPWLFWGDALTTFAAIGLLLAFIPETVPDPERLRRSLEGAGPAAERAEHGSAVAAFFRRPVLVGYCAIILFTNFIYAQTHFGMPLYTQHAFGADGARIFGLLISCNGLVVLLCTNLVLRLTIRVPALVGMALGAVFYAAGFAGYMFPLPLPALFATTALWTFGEILAVTNGGAWVASRTPMNFRGRFQAIQHLITGTGSMLSPLIGGFIVQAAGVPFLWGVVVALSVACAFAFRALHLRDEAEQAAAGGV